MKSILLFSGLLVFLIGITTRPIYAQSGDRCQDYATHMVAQDQRARQMRCHGWNHHSNYQHHYSWCSARVKKRIDEAIGIWNTRFQTCQFAASGSPAAQQALRQQAGPKPQLASKAFCQKYSSQMINLSIHAASKRCTGVNMYIPNLTFEKWCLALPAAKSNQSLAYWRQKVNTCRRSS